MASLISRALVVLIGLFTLAFIITYAFAWHPYSRAWITQKLIGSQIEAIEADGAELTEGNENSAAVRGPAVSAQELNGLFASLASELLKSRNAVVLGDAQLGQEIVRLRTSGKWSEGQALEERESENRKIRDETQYNASKAIQALREAMASDLSTTQNAAKSFLANNRDPDVHQMLEQIMALANQPGSDPSNTKGNFESMAFGAWLNHAFKE